MVLAYTGGSKLWDMTLLVTPNSAYPIVVAVASTYSSNPISRPAEQGGLSYWVNGYMANCKAANPACQLTDPLVQSIWAGTKNAIDFSWNSGEKPKGTPPAVLTHCEAKAAGY